MLDDIVTRLATSVRLLKEHAETIGDEQIPIQVEVWREGIPILLALVSDATTLTAAIECAAWGCDADAIGITAEIWYDRTPDGHNPLTGQPWAPGEQADVAINHDGLAQGWVGECIACLAGNQAEHISALQLPFKHNAGVLTWGDPVVPPYTFLHSVLEAAMATPSGGQLWPVKSEAERTARDLATAATLSANGAMVAMAVDPEDTERMAAVTRMGRRLN